MIKRLLVLAVAGAMASPGWTADKDRSSKQEAVGIGSGAAIGAAAGGPVGLILGAAFGGWLGDRFHEEREQRLAAEARYDQSSAESERLATLLAGSEQDALELEAALRDSERFHRAALEEALDIQVYFRTEESALDPGAEERLARIAEIIAPMDGVAVLLEGHADARGDEAYNVQLSAARAEAVREVFVRAGFPEERIAVTAEGERQATATEQDVDSLALDRRVHINILGRDATERVARE